MWVGDLFSTEREKEVNQSVDNKRPAGPRASPRAVAAWESLFESLPSAGSQAREAESREAESREAGSREAGSREAESEGSSSAETSPGTQLTGTAPADSQSAERERAEQASLQDALRASAALPAPEPQVALPQPAVEPAVAVEPAIDRPASPFHVYEWVLSKLRERPATSYAELCRRGEAGNFRIAEGHYKRARRVIDGELPKMSQVQLDALIEDTLALIRAPLDDLRALRGAAEEIAQICDDAFDRYGD